MPLLHLLVGPNGAGKTTFHEHVLKPVTGLPFVNADEIARAQWPDAERDHSYEAAKLAAERRDAHIANRQSFIAETVFSHPSKLELISRARGAGFIVILHVILVPLELSMRRVEARIRHGGHPVPPDKQRGRFPRVWPLVAEALRLADEGFVYDNTTARHPYLVVAHFEHGRLIGEAAWPDWSPLKPGAENDIRDQ